MNLRRTFAFTRRALLQFRHDRRTLAFVLMMPLLMILIFGYTFSGDVTNVKITVVDRDEGLPAGVSPLLPNGIKLAEQVTNNLNDETFAIEYSNNIVKSKQRVDKGEIWAVIIYPKNFTVDFFQSLSNTSNPYRPSVEIYLDGSNPTIYAAIMKTVNQAVMETLDELSDDINVTSAELPISFNTTYAYGGGDIEFIDYFAPGVISFAIMMVTTIITIILFVNERRTATLQRLLASPASEAEIVFGYALAFAVIGICQSIVILVAAILIFNITIVGNVFLALLVVMLLAIGHQGLGILLSAWAKNELQAVQFIPLIIFPSVLLAGLFWPVESIPKFLQPLSYFIPLRYGIDASRSVMLRGWGVGEIWVDLIILLAFATLTLTGSMLLLKRRK